jgi:hypothetical protein
MTQILVIDDAALLFRKRTPCPAPAPPCVSWPGRPPEGPARVRGRVPSPRSQESGRRVGGRLGSLVVALVLGSSVLHCPALEASPVKVRQAEGVAHGFLVLRTLDGKDLADGELLQVARGERVTSHLVFHFKDGSRHDETVVYSQHYSFRLLTDHLVQKGPSFPQPVDVKIDAVKGRVTVRYGEKGSGEKLITERLPLLADVANGLLFTVLKNAPRDGAGITVSMVAATPTPRVITLEATVVGEEAFLFGASQRKATHYVVKVKLGGVVGLVAPLVGKQPPDSHVWVLGGTAPTFVKAEASLFAGGPVWRIELTSPVWPAPRSPVGARGGTLR